MKIWRSVVGKLWMTIIGLVALVLLILGVFLLEYIDSNFENSTDIKHLFAFTAIIGFSLTTFFALFLLIRITKPLVNLKEAADAIRKGNYNQRVTTRSTDEIGELAHAFNHMAGQLEETINDLNNEKEQLGSILRSMSDAVITFKADQGAVLTNPQGERILQEWSSYGELEDHLVPPPLKGLYDEVIAGAHELTSKIHVKNETWSVVMTPLYSNDMIRGAVAVLRDITEEDRLDRMREDFVANVSHELRTPLSMLQGYSEALLDDIAATPEDRKEIAQIIHDESLRMGRLVQNLLDLSRMESGYFEMNFSKVDVGELILRMHRKFSAMARERGVAIELVMDHDERLLLESADEDRLEQVLTNLLDNALRHTPAEQQITIRANRVEASEPYVLIHIEDQGEGIPPEDLRYIFERFYKADKARTRETKNGNSAGTGLGLAIVKNIIDSHQGEIKVDSTVGQGTTFSIKIPASSQNIVEKSK